MLLLLLLIALLGENLRRVDVHEAAAAASHHGGRQEFIIDLDRRKLIIVIKGSLVVGVVLEDKAVCIAVLRWLRGFINEGLLLSLLLGLEGRGGGRVKVFL